MGRICGLALMILVLAAAAAWASSTPYEPPEGGDKWQFSTVVVKGTPIDRDAIGKAVLSCNMAETQHRIQLQASKLVPRAVYSVWLVKHDSALKKALKKSRADNPSRRLKADKYGKLAFAANLNACPQGKYDHVVVMLHGDGDPKNVRGAKAALKGKIP